MRIYLDNNATTAMHPEATEHLARLSAEVYGNPSSVHYEGRRAKQLLEEARDHVAALLHADSKDIVFTSGGTESNNAVLNGVVRNERECCHIVTTTIEHPSIVKVVASFEQSGHEVTWIRPDRNGQVSADEMLASIRPDTRLVTLMLANNETGVVQPVREVASACRDKGIWFHCDAVQALGKIPVDVEDLPIDSLALSGHKFHGPKGAGALWIRSGRTAAAHMLGGAQERRRRPGTEAVPLYGSLGIAAKKILDEWDSLAEMERLRDLMEERLLASVDGSEVNGRGATRVPNTTNLRIPDCDSESMVIGLDLEGFSVSGGAACSSGRVAGSTVLKEMGLTEEEALSSFRISLCRFTSESEILPFVEAVGRVAQAVRSSNAVVAR